MERRRPTNFEVEKTITPLLMSDRCVCGGGGMVGYVQFVIAVILSVRVTPWVEQSSSILSSFLGLEGG